MFARGHESDAAVVVVAASVTLDHDYCARPSSENRAPRIFGSSNGTTGEVEEKRLGSGCNVTETHQVDLRLLVKAEYRKEEEYDHVISCLVQDEEEEKEEKEKPFAEPPCEISDNRPIDETDSSDETLQTAAEIEVEIEEDEQQDYLLEELMKENRAPWIFGSSNGTMGEVEEKRLSCDVTETHQVALRLLVKADYRKEEEYDDVISCLVKDEEEEKEEEEEKPFAEPPCEISDNTDDADSSDETLQTAAEIEVEIEEDEQQDYLLEGVSSEHPHLRQQQIHGQNDELNLQLRGRLHHCTVCRKSFTAMTELQKHQQTHSVSVNEKPYRYECTQCGWAFSKRSELKSHILIHTGGKPYKCTQCGKTFSKISTLELHILKHTGEVPHYCTQCDKAFSRMSTLERHMLKHTGEKPHNCAQCGKAFSTLLTLERHMLIHTGEVPHCIQCGRAFLTMSTLERHMLKHTGEKPHNCAQRKDTFGTFKVLEGHMLTRTGEKLH